ncbi:Cytochrome P450 71A9 [Platanthera guangdongensis]|uniref:Cytochrome P450 71A9 n=1 Tax=Platanthera guangdongensis TaxID=2320717 RepID=A0ABR2MSF7_9ASPA
MTELIRNPRVMIKLQQELQQHAAHSNPTVDDNNSGEVISIIHERDLEKLDYLKQVIKESFRLHPPAPLLVPRETTDPCEIHGYKIPAKTRVLINAFAIATDPGVWEKPLEFRPERFERDDGADFTGKSFEYLPFGAGRRRCPGAGFAAVLVQLAVANLVHCFDWSMADGMKAEDMNMDEAIGITVHKKELLRLVAKYKW